MGDRRGALRHYNQAAAIPGAAQYAVAAQGNYNGAVLVQQIAQSTVAISAEWLSCDSVVELLQWLCCCGGCVAAVVEWVFAGVLC